MSTRAWVPRPPADAPPSPRFPDCVPDEPVDLRAVHVRGARLTGVRLPERSAVVDVTVIDCDVAGLVAESARVERLACTEGRWRGVTWLAGTAKDVVVERVQGTDVAWRFCTLRRVVLRDCRLAGMDFTESVFDEVRMENCDLRGARFDHCTVKQLRLAGCDLADVTGARFLGGASVHPDDVLALGRSLAFEHGIAIETDPDG